MAEEKIGAKFKGFLAKEGKVVSEGKNAGIITDINLSQYKAFGKECGITESVIKQVAGFEQEISTGAFQYAIDKLGENIDEAKKNGASEEELKKLTYTVRITLPNGTRRITAMAFSENSNPANRSEKVIHYGNIRDRTKLTRAIEKSVTTEAESFIKKKLGIA